MSYYNNVEFQINFIADSSGGNTQSPIMGQFVGTGTSNNGFTSVAVDINTPYGDSTGQREPYSYLYLKGIVFKKGADSPVHPFEIKTFIDYPYSSLVSTTQAVTPGQSTTYTSLGNVVGYPPEDHLITSMVSSPFNKTLLFQVNFPGGNNNWPLTVKGTYLLV